MTDLGIAIARNPGSGGHKFKEVFQGFGTVSTVRKILGPRADAILSDLKVVVRDTGAYLHVDEKRGNIVVDRRYLKTAEEAYLYLDVIHELVHIRQLSEGLDLFNASFSYTDRPTELEAYRVTVDEARRIGLTEWQIEDYLKVEWVDKDDFRRFLSSLGIRR